MKAVLFVFAADMHDLQRLARRLRCRALSLAVYGLLAF
jgi:hypothetical protein